MGQINETGNELDREEKNRRETALREGRLWFWFPVKRWECEEGLYSESEWPFSLCFLLEDGGMFRNSLDNDKVPVFWKLFAW